MPSSRLRRKKETLEGIKRYQRLLLTPTFTKHLQHRKKMLEEKIYHLRYIAQDCRDWKSSDLEAIKRGMEISILKYRLAKELSQEAREVLDNMLADVFPYLSDPRELEDKVWEVFDNEDLSDYEETERNEAEQKLNLAGFNLVKLPQKLECTGNRAELSEAPTDRDITNLLRRETELVNQQTERLLDILEQKKNRLDNLRDLDDLENRTTSEADPDEA